MENHRKHNKGGRGGNKTRQAVEKESRRNKKRDKCRKREREGGGKAARTVCNLSQVKCTAHVHVRGKAQLACTARRVTQGEGEGEREDKR